MEILKKVLSDRRFHRLAGVMLVLVCGAALALWKSGVSAADVVRWGKEMKVVLVDHPVWLFLAMVVLPGMPFPASVLFVLAGVVWGKNPAAACGIGIAALALNQMWTYALAAGPAHSLVGRLLARFGWKIPVLSRESVTDTVLILRLTPGLPLFVQNYVLGLLRVPFGHYLWVSLACSGPIVIGMILGSAGLTDGRWKTAVVGICVLVLAVALIRVLRRKWRVGEALGGKR